jgi:23S rRNA (cytosine1962-C5)-methyltransferase
LKRSRLEPPDTVEPEIGGAQMRDRGEADTNRLPGGRPSVSVSRKAWRRLHPWIFSNEVRQVEGKPGSGDVVAVTERGRHIGSAIYSPHSLIRARLFTADDQDLDFDFLTRVLAVALHKRREWFPDEQDYRLAHGESDGLPGLVVDKFGEHLVLQVYAQGFESRLDVVVAALREQFKVESVTAKNDFALREVEGLPRYERVLFGTVPDCVTMNEGGSRFQLDITGGQKTGFYLDQRPNRARVRDLASGRSVLDVFSYSGGFSVNAALGGARSVLAVDSSATACELVTRNAGLNGVGDRVRTRCGDAFEVLRGLNSEGQHFDLIVVDPPAFAKSQRDRPKAIRGHRDVNLLAMRLLKPGGILLSCSCSHHISWDDLADALAQASQACASRFRIIERGGQSPDHPVLLNMPESEYLRSYLLQLI